MLIEMMIDFCSKFKEGYFASVWSLCKLFGKEHMVIPNLLGSYLVFALYSDSLQDAKLYLHCLQGNTNVFCSTCFKGSLIMVACSYLQ